MKNLFLTLALILFCELASAQIAPSEPQNVTAYGNDFNEQTIMVIVNYDSVQYATSYTVTPLLILNGNSFKAITSLAKTFDAGSPQPYRWAVGFHGPQLLAASEVLTAFSGNKKNLKFRFKVEAINSAGTSPTGISKNPGVTVR